MKWYKRRGIGCTNLSTIQRGHILRKRGYAEPLARAQQEETFDGNRRRRRRRTVLASGLGGNVRSVLDSPRIAPPPATLEQARSAPGRAERIEALTRLIEDRGIKYVFFQQVSITGRVMGKGVVSTFFPQVAERGYQLVYGATANLFTDRYGNYIGFGPEESELAAMADLDTFAVLPVGRARRARVLRLLRHRDRRAAGRRPAPEPQAGRRCVRAGARLPVHDRDRARDDVAEDARGRCRRPRA